MKKKLLLLLVVSACCFSCFGQAKWNQRYQDYIDQYKDIAIEEMLRYGIPASITLAQGVFESGAGSSELATKGNNHFGIKCHGWTGRTTYHDDDAKQECFRAYNSALESYEDHSQFLKNSQRYQGLFQLGHTDYKGWAHGLKAAGYATNPQYAYRLINLIETYNLSQYDHAKSYDKFIVEHQEIQAKTRRRITTPGVHQIRMCNKNYYIIARRGDTFRSIGEELELSYRRLASYNERDKNDRLEEGDIIYLKKKRTRADKSFKNRPHIVKPGESMYTISQKYAIQLRSLYKKNKLTPDYQIRTGDRLVVY